MKQQTQPLKNAKEAAAYIGVSLRTLRRMIAENKPRPPEIRVSESVIRYRVSDLDEWLDRNRAIVPAN